MITFTIIIEDIGSGMCRMEIKTTPQNPVTYTDTEDNLANMIASALKQVINQSSGKKISST